MVENPQDNQSMCKIMQHLIQNRSFSYSEAIFIYFYAYDYYIMMQDFGHVFPERALGMLGLEMSSWDDFLQAHPDSICLSHGLPNSALASGKTELTTPVLAYSGKQDYMEKVSPARRKQPDSRSMHIILKPLMERDGYTYEQAKMLYFYSYHYEWILEDCGRMLFSWAMAMLNLSEERGDDLDDYLNAGYPEEIETEVITNRKQHQTIYI